MDGYEADYYGIPDDDGCTCGECGSWDACPCGCGRGLCSMWNEWTGEDDGCEHGAHAPLAPPRAASGRFAAKAGQAPMAAANGTSERM